MADTTYNLIQPDSGVAVKAWTKGVPLEDAARQLDRGCRSCGQRHGRREVSSIASRELEGKLRRFLTVALTHHLVRVFLEEQSGERKRLRQHGRLSWRTVVTSEDHWSNVYT